MLKSASAALIACIAVAACTAGATSSATAAPLRPVVFVSNGTDLSVTLVVNGSAVASATPRTSVQVSPSALPPLPWSIAATSATGRVLATMDVPLQAAPTDPTMHVIPMARVDLSCGRLTIWAGDYPPSGPAYSAPAGSPGDCQP